MTREDMADAVGHARDRQFADLLLLVVGMVSETHPEVLRDALGRVFDLGAVEEATRRTTALVQQSAERAAEVRALLFQVMRDVDRIEERQGQLEYRVEKGHSAVDRLAEAFKKLVALFKNQQPKTEAKR